MINTVIEMYAVISIIIAHCWLFWFTIQTWKDMYCLDVLNKECVITFAYFTLKRLKTGIAISLLWFIVVPYETIKGKQND